MTAVSKIKVYATQPHPCSYLREEIATTLFIDPATPVDKSVYSQLSDLGFRRSGKHLYRPHCRQCNACISTRVIADEFTFKRRHRRIWNRNQDLTVEVKTSIDDDVYYALYERYIEQRHNDGDMYPASREQYESFLTSEWKTTRYYAFHLEGNPIAVAVTDQLDSGLSAIYTFYEPALSTRSLGVYAILWQIELAKNMGLPYLYLGYWIKSSEKMRYKLDYRPSQLLVEDQWVTLR